MNYLFNDRNQVRSAVLSALNVEPSSVIYRTDTAAKAGGGSVTVTGPYTGSHDTTIDVEILDSTGDSSQVSEPVFSGVGNGTMTDAAVTALDPQDIAVTLVDLGTPTTAAQAPFQGATLVAKTTGVAGNAIIVSIDANGIVREDSIYSTQHAISAGTNSFTGSEWNFGALALVNGKLDPATPRIAFGDDPQVYRPYKVYDASQGQYVYSFSPAPIRDVPAFVTVKNVTGTWTVHITDGVSPEDFTGIVTLYDALSAIQSGSELVSVHGVNADSPPVIVNDLTPNGQGANDLSVWTDSYVLSVVGTGSDFVQRNDLQVAVASAAPTETLRIICTDASRVGFEVWSVNGDISGDLGSAISGVAFAAGSYGFTIPQQLPGGTVPGGTISVQWNPLPRGDDEQEPVLCVKRAVLGALAQNAQYTFTYKKKPPAACVCVDDIHDSINWACLGIDPPTGGGEPVAETSILTRRRALAAAYTTFAEANTDPPVKVDPGDISWALKGFGIFADLLNLLASSAATLTYPARQDSHAYDQDEQIEVVISSVPYRFAATTPGTTASSAPDFSGAAAIGATVNETSGGVQWTNIGKAVLLMFDDAFNDFVTDADTLAGVEALQDIQPWKAGTVYSSANRVTPTVPSDKFYTAAPFTVDSLTAPTATSGAIEPVWADGILDYSAAGDGSGINWTEHTFTDEAATAFTDDRYFERYRAPLREVSLAAGIVPNFDDASASGTPCWRDFQDSQFWFVNTDGVLKPLQIGHTYHSCKDALDEDGNPIIVSTEEFALQLLWGCPDKLKVGDSFTVSLADVSGGPHTYQPSDEWDVSVAHADPLQLGGGQDGDDTLTWSVTSSIGTAFAQYALITTALAPYSDGGLTFQITPGGIPFALNDTFRLSVEGGHFQWRRDGGSWSSSTVIGDTSASDGLTIVFAGGAAPSWVAGDAWSFAAEATNGPDRAKSPTDGRFAWNTSTELTIVPDDPADCTRFAVFDHHIPSDATITLQGSDDGFSTTPTSIPITWTARNLFVTFAAVTRAAWRLVVNRPGDFFWAFLGQQMQPSFTNHDNGQTGPDVGHFTRRRRAAGVGVRAGIGGDVLHDVVSADSLADFEAGFDYACANDDGGFGLVINDAAGETSLVRFAGTDIETKDQVFDYQAPRSARYQTFTVPVEALP